jgi:hypothetical protein
MLSRTLLDDTARLIWLAMVRNSPDELDTRLLRYIFDSLEHEERFMRMARETEHEWADEELARIAEELEDVKQEAARRGIPLKRMPDAREMLRSLARKRRCKYQSPAYQGDYSSDPLVP